MWLIVVVNCVGKYTIHASCTRWGPLSTISGFIASDTHLQPWLNRVCWGYNYLITRGGPCCMGFFFHNFLAILDIEDNASEALQALMTTDSCLSGGVEQWNRSCGVRIQNLMQ